tara:strand:- start:2284 stop:3771 length:1488 start_codon:yes stop_codon:yes gene_type:complete
MIGPLNFNFLNKTFHIKKSSDWNNKSLDKLWLYNLHYFEDLLAEKSLERNKWHFDYINNWIENNKSEKGIGWEPYPTSLRICNWIKWFNEGEHYENHWIESLSFQADLLSQTIEFQNMGNHLFVNAKALIFSGTFLKGSDADRWLEKGLNILDKEIDEQILSDGAHFELSPMYHSIILMDLLDLINLAKYFKTEELMSRIEKWKKFVIIMFNWGSLMNHPDKNISFFNDSAFDIAPKLSNLKQYIDELGITLNSKQLPTIENDFAKIFHMRNSGYIRTDINEKVCLIKDCAKIGPDYIPAHGHADTLSFELSINGKRVFVNSGVSSYNNSDQRLYERGTLSHNTVTVDNRNSSEVWSNFRVARRAIPTEPIFSKVEDSLKIECSHDGYKSLFGGVTHLRSWEIRNSSLLIEDRLVGKYNKAIARFILHPSIQIELLKNVVNFYIEGESISNISFNSNDIKSKEVLWSPCFGKTEKTNCIEVQINNKKLLSKLSWN